MKSPGPGNSAVEPWKVPLPGRLLFISTSKMSTMVIQWNERESLSPTLADKFSKFRHNI